MFLLNERLQVHIQLMLSVYAILFVDTNNDDMVIVEETDEFHRQSLDGNKVSSA